MTNTETAHQTQTFGARSTADDVLAGVDLTGKRILVTGVSSGIGLETSRALVARGADVVGAARDLAKADSATAAVRAAAVVSGANIELVELDLASLANVRACADALLADGRPFDIIIANAGVMATPQGQTRDGFETQFGTNHLGHFVLVNRIASLLRAGGRLVMVSSGGHRFSDVDLDDPSFERTAYDELVAYGRSKTANILFAVEFDRRHRERGVRATAIHPGVVQETDLGRHMASDSAEKITAMIDYTQKAHGVVHMAYKSIPQGAATSVWAAAVAPADEVGGRYCEDCHVAGLLTGEGSEGGVVPYALDGDRAKALWAKSEEMVGEHF
jgi:NAD(P)-dependent dehydrogenase (short-subunit alcohol dehydrogenase family)